MSFSSITGIFTHIPTDWIILFFFAISITAYTMYFGASRAIALSIALPVTFVFESLLPQTVFLGSFFKQTNGSFASAAIALLILAVLTLCMHVMSRDFSNSAFPLQAILTGVATTIILAVFWIQIPALTGLWHFAPQAAHIFGTTFALPWLLASYLMLAAARK